MYHLGFEIYLELIVYMIEGRQSNLISPPPHSYPVIPAPFVKNTVLCPLCSATFIIYKVSIHAEVCSYAHCSVPQSVYP